MDLAIASTFFANTSVNGWNGESWDMNVGEIALLPSDRFISEHETDLNCQYALVDVDSTALDDYSVIQIESTEQNYLVGIRTMDVQGDAYSKIYMLRRAFQEGEVLKLEKTYSASGMAKELTRQVVGNYFCGTQYGRPIASRKFARTTFSASYVYLPSDCEISSANELRLGDSYYAISEVYQELGFNVCRTTRKNV